MPGPDPQPLAPRHLALLFLALFAASIRARPLVRHTAAGRLSEPPGAHGAHRAPAARRDARAILCDRLAPAAEPGDGRARAAAAALHAARGRRESLRAADVPAARGRAGAAQPRAHRALVGVAAARLPVPLWPAAAVGHPQLPVRARPRLLRARHDGGTGAAQRGAAPHRRQHRGAGGLFRAPHGVRHLCPHPFGYRGERIRPRARRNMAAACHRRGAARAAARPHAGDGDGRRRHRVQPAAAQARSAVQRVRSLSPAVRHRLLRARRRGTRRRLRAALAHLRAGAGTAARAADARLYRHADADGGRIGRGPAHAAGVGARALRRDELGRAATDDSSASCSAAPQSCSRCVSPPSP